MPINLNKEQTSVGSAIFAWEVNEYEKHARSKRWYVIAGLLGTALLLYSIISGNYLFALVVVLVGIILFLQDVQAPIVVEFVVTEAGVIVGSKFYPFREFRNYWIIYNPPEVKNIYFATNSLVKHRLQIPLLDNDPRPIREFLNQFIVEDLDQEQEPLSDRVGRMFKIN
mgnify:FL=1